ncbi:MAG TPA: hypothetical protein VII06_03095 [Chloroflexota bacterium]|jgi:hypothetical protein
MGVEYRPLWWRPWLEPVDPQPAAADDSPDVTGFQLPDVTESAELPTADDAEEREP